MLLWPKSMADMPFSVSEYHLSTSQSVLLKYAPLSSVIRYYQTGRSICCPLSQLRQESRAHYKPRTRDASVSKCSIHDLKKMLSKRKWIYICMHICENVHIFVYACISRSFELSCSLHNWYCIAYSLNEYQQLSGKKNYGLTLIFWSQSVLDFLFLFSAQKQKERKQLWLSCWRSAAEKRINLNISFLQD